MELEVQVIKKNSTYGYHNISKLGQKGVYVRTSDKTERLHNIVWLENDNAVPEETVLDTWLDLAGYAVLGYMQAIKEQQEV